MVNMRKLNSVEINTEKGVAVVGGGAIVKEVTSKAKASKVHVGKFPFLNIIAYTQRFVHQSYVSRSARWL